MPEMKQGAQLPPEVKQADMEMEGATKAALGSTAPQVVLPAQKLQQFGQALNEAKGALSGGEIPETPFEVGEDGPMPPEMFAEAVAMESALKGVKEAKRFGYSAKNAASNAGGLTEAIAALRTMATDEALLAAVQPGGEEKPSEELPEKGEDTGEVDDLEGLM
jgi:hypothetical protein